MRIIDIGKENVDIEINSKTYRLSGELYKDGFVAFASRISLILSESAPMSMEERLQIASTTEKLSPKPFIDWLKNPNGLIPTKLIDINEDEKNMVMEAIYQEGDVHNFPIHFIHDKE